MPRRRASSDHKESTIQDQSPWWSRRFVGLESRPKCIPNRENACRTRLKLWSQHTQADPRNFSSSGQREANCMAPHLLIARVFLVNIRSISGLVRVALRYRQNCGATFECCLTVLSSAIVSTSGRLGRSKRPTMVSSPTLPTVNASGDSSCLVNSTACACQKTVKMLRVRPFRKGKAESERKIWKSYLTVEQENARWAKAAPQDPIAILPYLVDQLYHASFQQIRHIEALRAPMHK